MPRSERYDRTAVALHWLIAALVVAQFAWGWWMQGIPKQPPGARVDAFNLHKSVGLTILALMLLRVSWRAAHAPPALPPMPSWQATLARLTHVLLYVVLFLMPLSGYLGSVWSGYPVKYFGMTLPDWNWKNPALKELASGVHLVTAWVLATAAGLHVAGALKHVLVDRDGLLARMGIGSGGD